MNNGTSARIANLLESRDISESKREIDDEGSMNTSFEAIERLHRDLPTIRNVAGWSAERLAELLDISRMTVVNLENTEKKMSKIQYLAIRALLQEEVKTNHNNALENVLAVLVDRDNVSEKMKQELRDQVKQVAKNVGRRAGSAAIAKNVAPIFDRLAKGMPLTPIEDTDDAWNDISRFCRGDDPYTSYQCKRMSSLFKYVYDDGRVEYTDVDRFCCYNKSEDGDSYHSGLVDRVMYEKFPITMPYYPGNAIKVICEDYLTDRKNGDFDTVGILYSIKPDGERIEINRFFKEDCNDFKEISVEEYHDRIAMHEARENLEAQSNDQSYD